MPFQPLSASLCGRNVGIPGRLGFRSKDHFIFLSKFHVKEPLETGDLSSPGGVLVNASPPCPDGRPCRQFFQSRWQSRGKNASAGKAQHLLRSLLYPDCSGYSNTKEHIVQLCPTTYCRSLPRWCIHSASV